MEFNSVETTLVESNRDFNSNWVTAVDFWDDNYFVVAENSYNLFVLGKQLDATVDIEKRRLETVSCYHLGEFVNKLQKGTIMHEFKEGEKIYTDALVYGTITGSLGLIFKIDLEKFKILDKLQKNLYPIIKGVGGFDHQL